MTWYICHINNIRGEVRVEEDDNSVYYKDGY